MPAINHAMGRRDYAVLMVLAKLGLRASEVAALSLDDIDWQSGSILVHGKGRRQAAMPLRHDVGAAIVAYISLSPSRAGDCCTNTCTACSGSCRGRSDCGRRGSATGEDVERELPVLSTFLGHVNVRDTYWYLSAAPELMAHAARRLDERWEVRS